jgi:hypothetical protein
MNKPTAPVRRGLRHLIQNARSADNGANFFGYIDDEQIHYDGMFPEGRPAGECFKDVQAAVMWLEQFAEKLDG